MISKRIISLSICLLAIWSITAQEKALEKANQKYDEYSFSPAIDIYKKVLDKGFTSPDLLKRLGNAYYFNARYSEAADIYEKLVAEYEAVDTVITAGYYFRYAQSLKTLEKYAESEAIMEKFAAKASSSSIRKALESDYMAKIEENSGRYTLASFPYNSKYSDFAPAFYKKGLIFSSDRDTGNLARYRHTWNAKDFLDLYQVDSTQMVSKVPGEINTKFHESTSIVTKDGETMYFTRNNFADGKRVKSSEGTTNLKIYQASLVNGEWTDIIELPFNSDEYSVAHPMLSPDEKQLYFASDMPGTRGASDIWKVRIVGDGTFSSPVNLGDNINTEARETFPFITKNDVLYFSSDGHPGLGGLDVFATKIAFQEYDQPIVNVGRPINSKFDDFSYIIDDVSKKGYFSSNRLEGSMGDDDIYAFTEDIALQLDCLQEVTGTVRDRISNEILIGATVKLIGEDNTELATAITDNQGKYFLTLDCSKGNFVRALMEGYVPAEEFLPSSYGKPRIVDFYLERDLVTGGFGDDLAKLLQLSTIYFDLNKYNIRPDAEIEIQKVIAAMEKYPSLRLKVNAHTDSRGRDEYNLWLSQKRAEATVDYMVSKGISRERLQGEGYGEKLLLNNCDDGVYCTKTQHQLNRRSEFIIME